MKRISVVLVLATLVASSLAVMDLSKTMTAIDDCSKLQEIPDDLTIKLKGVLTKHAAAMVPGSDPEASMETMKAESEELFQSASIPGKFVPFGDCVKEKMQ